MANEKLAEPTAEQIQAWSHYGPPRINRSTTAKSPKSTVSVPSGCQIGEVRFIIGWIADQLTRMGWRAKINGSEQWAFDLPDGARVASNPDQADTEAADHPTNASRRLLETIDWNTRTVREVTTNLFVAGELHYALEEDRWRVVSVVRPDRHEIIANSSLVIRGIWPHPADPEAPDAPIFGVLGLLNDMLWLNRLSRSQSANRVGMRGIVGVADSMRTTAGASGEAFWGDFEASLSRPMDDPEDVGPVGIIGAAELVEPKDGGMKGLSWVIPEFPYDDKIDQRMEKLVQRLAYGLPIPPEILLGLQAQSKATAFQVEGASYRAHIEPVAELVAKVATDALQKHLDGVGNVEIDPDPTAILARRHSVSDVLEAFDRGAVGYDYLREVLGIPARAKPTDDDIALRTTILGRTQTVDGVQDPANVAADEPITAAADTPGPDVADQLLRIDTALFHELAGASQQAVSKARERIGAKLRSTPALKGAIEKSKSNEQIGEELANQALEILGADGDRLVAGALASTADWWQKRLKSAQEQAAKVLAQVDAEATFSQEASNLSAEHLVGALQSAVTEGRAPREAELRAVIRIAGQQG